ncbi:MAG: hypothetical protein WD052_08095 [Bacteroidales bacterium]
MNTRILNLLILITFSMVLMTGCSKNKDNISNWLVGTWNLEKYAKEKYDAGILTGLTEETNLGEVIFRGEGTGTDSTGSFTSGDFEWSNTSTRVKISAGGDVTSYALESFSAVNFVFSITEISGSIEEIELWYLSKN